MTFRGAHGGTETRPWNEVGPRTRLRLFRRTEQGLEPVALWLNEDGLPRDGRGWEDTFDVANERIQNLGLEHFTCTAHMLSWPISSASTTRRPSLTRGATPPTPTARYRVTAASREFAGRVLTSDRQARDLLGDPRL
ncbi:hypothetical protein [Streptomyces antimycoticus]|uniref:hypothetical protein n=1 Tax=Streptomyces antimycoticus TaxID=68175 RepID=UPI0010F59E11|nr:hypothetical protein [Streptomyces antimycoticus]